MVVMTGRRMFVLEKVVPQPCLRVGCFAELSTEIHVYPQHAPPPQDMVIKRNSLTLLEGMLAIRPDNRCTIKQVLSHAWFKDERDIDPSPGESAFG
jgi:serine/threonine protein kinase